MTERVVLAYSGGLDTSVAVRWLMENHGVEVIAVAVDVGQAAESGGEDWDAIRNRALAAGRRRGDRHRRPGRDGRGLLRAGPAGQRQVRGQVPAGVGAVAPGDRQAPGGRGPPARRHAGGPRLHRQGQRPGPLRGRAPGRSPPTSSVLAPARVWGLTREDCIEYAAKWDIPLTVTKEKLYSIDENLWGKAIECGVIEDPWNRPPEDVYTMTVPTATEPTEIVIGFESGVPVSLDGRGAVARAADRRAQPGRRLLRLRPPRHGREPPGRHQEPGDLRMPGGPGPAAGPRRPRGPDPRAGPPPREAPARAPLGRAGLRRPLVLARSSRRSTPSSSSPRATSPARCACASTRGGAGWSGAAARSASTTTGWPPTTPSDTFRHQDAEGFVRLWGLGVATWSAVQEGRGGDRTGR